MATCRRCGAPLKYDTIACANCGLTVTAPDPHAPAPVTRRRPLLIVAAGVAVAVVTVVAVWALFLRGPATNGDEFLGTWRSVDDRSLGDAVVTRTDGRFSVRITAAESGQQATVPAHLDGTRLVITPGDFSDSKDPYAKQVARILKLMAGDFRIEISSISGGRLLAHFYGTSLDGKRTDERGQLERVASPAPP